MRYDPVARTGFCIQQYGYGLGIDTNGYIWMSLWDGGIVKIAPDGAIVPGFPKPTNPSSMTTMVPVPANTIQVMAALPQTERVSPLTEIEPANEWVQPSLQNKAESTVAPLAEDPSVTFWVAPVDDWVQSSSPWTPGAMITLTVANGGSVVYTDSQVADTNGNFNFNLWNIFDLQRGQVVIVSDDTTTKTHTVMPLYVDGVDVTADTILGRADAGTTVDILGAW